MLAVGDQVRWHTLNGSETGQIKEISQETIVVMLRNGKFIVGHFTSFEKL